MPLGEIISICVSAVVTIVTGIIVAVLKNYIKEMKEYRSSREQKEKAKDELLLGMARVSLLENYNECEKKGFYSLEDRDVYGKLYAAYKINGGNGMMSQLAEKIRKLPTSDPNHHQGADAS